MARMLLAAGCSSQKLMELRESLGTATATHADAAEIRVIHVIREIVVLAVSAGPRYGFVA